MARWKLADTARRILPASILVTAASLALRRLDDFDTWWHLASGRWIVENRSVPDTDTLSYTVPDHAWINLQWLYDVVLYWLYRVGGPDILVVAATVCFTLAIWILLKNLRLSVGVVPACALALWALVLAEERFLIRPEMVSFILLGSLLWVLRTMREDGGRRLWLLPVIMVLWVNTHALFIVGLFCIACFVGGSSAARLPLVPAGWRAATVLEPDAMRRLLIAAAAAAAATLINPYFIRGVAFPLELLTRIDGSRSVFQAIGEFRAPFSGYFTTLSITAYQMLFFFGIATVGVAAAAGFADRRRSSAGFDLAGVAFFAAVAYISTLARRNMGLFAFGATPVIGMSLAVIAARLSPSVRRALTRVEDVAAPALVATCAVFVVAVSSNVYYQWNNATHAFGLGTFEANFPIHAAAFAREADLPGPVYNDLTSGGYLTWDSGGLGPVFIDGRLEVYDTEFFSEYTQALGRPALWNPQVNELGVQSVVLFHRWSNRHSLIHALQGDRAWSLVYHDEGAVIYVRTAGNEAAIARARERFPAWREKTRVRVDRRNAWWWQWPIERAVALQTYAPLHSTLGDIDGALELYGELLAMGIPESTEVLIRLRVGYYLARRGDKHQALIHLDRAAEIDPNNRKVQQLLAELRK